MVPGQVVHKSTHTNPFSKIVSPGNCNKIETDQDEGLSIIHIRRLLEEERLKNSDELDFKVLESLCTGIIIVIHIKAGIIFNKPSVLKLTPKS